MATTVTARLYLRNNGEVVVQTKRYPWPFKILLIPPFTPIPLLFWLLGYRGEWYDLVILNSLVYNIDDDMNLLALEAKELFNKRNAAEKTIKDNVEFIKSSDKTMKGYSTPFGLDLKLLSQMSMRDEVKTTWKEVFKLGDQKKGPRSQLNTEGAKSARANRMVSVPEDFKGMRYPIEDLATVVYQADDVMFNQGRKDNNNNGGGDTNPLSQKKLKGLNETDASHRERVKAIKAGTFDPNSWDYQQ